jgi:hypothetical protein
MRSGAALAPGEYAAPSSGGTTLAADDYFEATAGSAGFPHTGGAITIEFIARLAVDAAADTALFECGTSPSTDDNAMRLDVGFDGGGSRFRWTVVDAGGVSYSLLSSAAAGALIVSGVRYHLVATATGTPGTMVLYINGVQTASLTAQTGHEPVVARRHFCTIGKARSSDVGFAGDVTLLKMYSGAMESDGVGAAYAAHFPFAEHYWNFAKVRTDWASSPRVRRHGGSAAAASQPIARAPLTHRTPLRPLLALAPRRPFPPRARRRRSLAC